MEFLLGVAVGIILVLLVIGFSIVIVGGTLNKKTGEENLKNKL